MACSKKSQMKQISFKGTTLEDGAGGSEHLTSFDYAYRLEAVRDWLFEQSR